jgi:hypothetical protein
MSRLTNDGVLNDYSVPAQERMAFDQAPRRARARRASQRPVTMDTDSALRLARDQRKAADHAQAQSPMAQAIPGYARLKG